MTEFTGTLLAALGAVIAFALVLIKGRVGALAHQLTVETTHGVSTMLDRELTDIEKEKMMQQAGLNLLITGARIAILLVLSLTAAFLIIYLADWVKLSSISRSVDLIFRLDFIISISLLAALAAAIPRLWSRRSTEKEKKQLKSRGVNEDVLIHSLAFAHPRVGQSLSLLENRLFKSRIDKVEDQPPIFITSLARAGTTALLNAMGEMDQLASHTYRDMPFVTAPLLWSKIGSRNRTVETIERAHGDGMTIGLDSVEAFDEVLWMNLWPEKYNSRGISLWQDVDERDVDRQIFKVHFKKVALLRRPMRVLSQGLDVRYLSKNNANIARLRLLKRLFPQCSIVVPLRHPAAHAASLYRQHKNFLAIHAADPFSRKYMRDIGHFEFGELHTPILFHPAAAAETTPNEPDYWLDYWIKAYEEIFNNRNNLHFITQDAMRAKPDSTVNTLFEELRLNRQNNLEKYFRSHPDNRPKEIFSSILLKKADDLYHALSN